MPITPKEAFDHTNPGDPLEVRKANAEAICASVAANDAYIQSRSTLDQITAIATGGQSVPVKGEPAKPADVEATAVEEKPTGTAVAEEAAGTALSLVEDVVTASKPVVSTVEEVAKVAEELLTPDEKATLEKLLAKVGV